MQMSIPQTIAVPQQSVDALSAPIVIVGNGPAGMRAAREIRNRNPLQSIIIYGAEPWRPYNRIGLSSLLAGERDLASLTDQLSDDPKLEQRIGCEVTGIDASNHSITDSTSFVQPYSSLILALGSSPYVPPIEGADRKGVYTFRNLKDAEHLAARRVRTRRTLVVGGGLLGLEAARGMQKSNTEVVVIDHSDRLLCRQLDEEAAERLLNFVTENGLQVRLSSAVKSIHGDEEVTGVELFNGEHINCDTVILATGISPNTRLAKDAGIRVRRGIVVDNHMRTSRNDIYAIGECSEHKGRVYGLVAPGLEQASVAVHHLMGGDGIGQYQGSIAATRLKVLGENVFSIGDMADRAPSCSSRTLVFSNQSTYRRLVVRRFRLEGAIGIGDWPEQNRIQTAVTSRQLIMPWQLLNFESSGRIWDEEEAVAVANWPANTAVCQCTGVTRGEISNAISDGCNSVSSVTLCTGAGSVCGSCKPLVQDLLGDTDSPAEPLRWSNGLTLAGGFTLLTALLLFFAPSIPFNSSVQTLFQWDQLWRNGLFKQITGFSILALILLGLVLSPRKRLKKYQKAGHFDGWRLFHIVTGLLVVLALVLHTGFRLGYGLNFWLMFGFTGLLLVGGVLTLGLAQEHRLSNSLARRIRKTGLWVHILLFWPIPALLGFHIFKSYYF